MYKLKHRQYLRKKWAFFVNPSRAVLFLESVIIHSMIITKSQPFTKEEIETLKEEFEVYIKTEYFFKEILWRIKKYLLALFLMIYIE